MQDVLTWVVDNQPLMLDKLREIVAIPGVSPGGGAEPELHQAAQWVHDALVAAGFPTVRVFPGADRTSGRRKDADIVYAEHIVDEQLPTVLFYSHYDVQPVDAAGWSKTEPYRLEVHGDAAFGRGSQDDKGGFVAQLAAMQAFRETGRPLPVNVKFLVEGKEEVGSPFLTDFIQEQKDLLACDVLLVTDTENVEPGRPALTSSLRGCLTLRVNVKSAEFPSHSGMAGGGLADPAAALCILLSRLFPTAAGEMLPELMQDVRPLADEERRMLAQVEPPKDTLRDRFGVLSDVRLASPDGDFLLHTTRLPSVSIIGLQAGSVASPSNQVVASATAFVSVRVVADQHPRRVAEQLRNLLTRDAPWSVNVSVELDEGSVAAWMVEPSGEVFSAALRALETGYGREPAYLGCGGSIGYIGPAAELLQCVPLLMGITGGNAHSHDEFLDLADWLRLQKSIVVFLHELAAIGQSG